MEIIASTIIFAAVIVSVLVLYGRYKRLQHSMRHRMPRDAQRYILNGMAVLDALEEDEIVAIKKVRNAKSWFTRALEVGTKRESKKDVEEPEL